MWQRKQSLFLSLAAVLAGLMYYFPLATYAKMGGEGEVVLRLHGAFKPDGTRMPQDLAIPLHWLMAVLIILLVATIFLFKRRARQMRLVRLAFLYALGMIVGLMFTHNAVASGLGTVGSVDTHLQAAFYFPFAMLLLIWLADHGIRKDEALVKSADRLR